MRPELAWVLGRGGFLGGWIARVLSGEIPGARPWPALPRPLSWSDPARSASGLEEEAERFADDVRADGASWTVLWCAGAGGIGTPPARLDAETEALRRLLDALGRRSERLGPGKLVLASSAGGVYGDSSELPLTEDSPCRPISAYGRNKLVQERLCLEWSERTGLGPALVARISNLYGPSRGRPAGLVGRIARSVVRHEAVHVYVPMDTLRDYLHVRDAARAILGPLGTLSASEVRLVASGQSTSIGSLVGMVARIAKRRPRIVLASQPRHLEQPLRLAFRSLRDPWPPPSVPLPEGIHSVIRAELAGYQEAGGRRGA